MIDLSNDVYFDEDYISLYLKENESIFTYSYTEGDNYFHNISIKRPICKVEGISVNDGFFDLETAYGYGGYRMNTHDPVFVKEALSNYYSFCKKNRIVSEFVRFHPFSLSNRSVCDWCDFFVDDRETVVVDLSLNKENRWSMYHKKTRNILRRCEENLSFHEIFDVKEFIDLYFETMLKNDADDFYFFDRNYFDSLLQLNSTKLFGVYYNEQLISAGFFMFGKEIGHYHLSGNASKFKSLNGNYFLIDSVCDLMRDDGLKYLHLGGGRTNDAGDALFRFKRKFSNEILQFQIAGKIFDQEKYDEYCAIWDDRNRESEIKYFLKYRL